MKRILYLAGGILVLFILIVLIGLILPSKVNISKQILVQAESETIYKLVRAVDKYPTWRSDVKAIKIVGGEKGLPIWEESSSLGYKKLKIAEVEETNLIVIKTAGKSQGITGKWTYEFIDTRGKQTMVKITEDISITNPITKFINTAIVGTDARISGILEDIKTRISEDNKANLK